MNLSHYLKNRFLSLFSHLLEPLCRPTYSSMSCKVALKSMKKSYKNQYLRHV
jgi:hypothetical protein